MPITSRACKISRIAAASVASPSTTSITRRPGSGLVLGISTMRAVGKTARICWKAARGSLTEIASRAMRARVRWPASNITSTAVTNSVATTAIGTAPRPHAMPMPIITNITAASRGSLMPERKRMNAPSPTSPNARAMLSPMTATISAPATAISVCACADSRAGGSALGISRRHQR